MTLVAQPQNTAVSPHTDYHPATGAGNDVLDNLRSYAESWRYAAEIGFQLSNTQFSGPFYGRPEDMTVAVLMGASLGIPPQLVAKSIYVVHGTPTVSGKTAISLAIVAGYTFERVEFGPTRVTVKVTTPQGKEHETTYTIERATAEGLVKGNKLQYGLRPAKMLFWKCIGELADQVFPHLINGMGIAQDYVQSDDTRSTDAGTEAEALINETVGAIPLPADVPAPLPVEQGQPTAAPAQAQQRTENAMDVLNNILGPTGPATPAQAPVTATQAPLDANYTASDMESLAQTIAIAPSMDMLTTIYNNHITQLTDAEAETMIGHLNRRQGELMSAVGNSMGDS